jgi:multiple sugar transport system ATP-binding protein
MRGEIIRVQRRIAAPTLYVTHDQTEAMTMGDRVAILRDGLLQQLGTPDQVYDRPVNAFVAGFIGSPSMNLLPARLEADGDGCAVSVGGARLAPPRLLEQRPVLRGYLGKPITLGIRPEDFGTDGDGGEIEVTVTRLESLGSELVAYLAPAGMEDTLLTARLERRASLAEGSATRVSVDVERLYFFDPDSGAALT